MENRYFIIGILKVNNGNEIRLIYRSMRFKQWLANEIVTSPLKAPSQNPVADANALKQAVQTTLQSQEIPKIASQNMAPAQINKAIIPVAQGAIQKNFGNKSNVPQNVTPMDVARATIPQLELPKPNTNPLNPAAPRMP